MTRPYNELRANRDFGDILTVYFDFLKQNLKRFTNVFLAYNGIFLIGLLVCSYLLVSGFFGLIEQNSDAYGMDSGSMPEFSSMGLLIGAMILYMIIMLVVVGFNYALSSSYLHHYEGSKGADFHRSEVWRHCRENLGNTLLFILMLVPIFLGLMIVALIFAFIPILGLFAQYIIQFFVTAWIGVSFFAMISQKLGVIESFGEGWKLVSGSFWKSVGVNFILGLLNGLLMLMVLVIPGIIMGVYTFHVVENNVALGSSILATGLYTLGLCLFLVLVVFAQCLSQFVNGILYYALHEKTYNLNTRNKIEQIGQRDI